jgi:hypothetical protein
MATREAPRPVKVDCVVGCTGGRFQAFPLVEGINQYDRRLLSLRTYEIRRLEDAELLAVGREGEIVGPNAGCLCGDDS